MRVESDHLVLELNETASDLPRERVADILAAKPTVVFVDLGSSVTGLRVLELLSQEAPELTLIAARLAQRLVLLPNTSAVPEPVGVAVNQPDGGVPMRIRERMTSHEQHLPAT